MSRRALRISAVIGLVLGAALLPVYDLLFEAKYQGTGDEPWWLSWIYLGASLLVVSGVGVLVVPWLSRRASIAQRLAVTGALGLALALAVAVWASQWDFTLFGSPDETFSEEVALMAILPLLGLFALAVLVDVWTAGRSLVRRRGAS